MSGEQRLEGLVLRSSPLGEHDRLITLLSNQEGLTRLAAPGARRPKGSLAAAVPLAVLSLQVGGRSGLKRIRQLQVLRNFSGLAERLETLAAAQGLAELALLLVPSGDAVAGLLEDLLLQLTRLEQRIDSRRCLSLAVATVVVRRRARRGILGQIARHRP
ncbi:MAG: DNA repair protein RecO, partial [Vulcanococcus sp.]